MFMYLFLIFFVILLLIFLIGRYCFFKYGYKDLQKPSFKKKMVSLYSSPTLYGAVITGALISFLIFFGLLIASILSNNSVGEEEKYNLLSERAECVALLIALDSDENELYKYLDSNFIYSKIERYNNKIITGREQNKSFWFGNITSDYYNELEIINIEDYTEVNKNKK